MSKFICKCVDDIFHTYDYNNILLKENLLKIHNNKEQCRILRRTITQISNNPKIKLALIYLRIKTQAIPCKIHSAKANFYKNKSQIVINNSNQFNLIVV